MKSMYLAATAIVASMASTAPVMTTLLGGVACAEAAVAPTDADAQATPAADAPTTASTDGVEEIVVTAQKRSENLQRVPIAITAVTADRAAKLGVTDGASLISLVPGLNFQRQSNSSIPYIRGIGTSVGQTGNEPSVAFYVDDVYIPAGAGSILNFNAIDRIEVLKGPQGTLFGRNATGGVVSVYTKNPTHDFHADVSGGYANYDTYSGSATVSGGLSDTLSALASVYGSKQNHGWGRNPNTGNPTYLNKDYGGRIKLLFEPDDATRVLLIGDYDKTTTGQGVTYQPAKGTAALFPFIPGGYFAPAGTSFYDTTDNIDPIAIAKQRGVSLNITHEFDGGVSIKSVTAYRKLNAVQRFGYDPVPAIPGLGPILNVDIDTMDKTTTQEFQIISPSGSNFSWVAGVFYFHDIAGYVPLNFRGLFLPQLAPTATRFAESYGIQTTNSYAGYGQATYTIAEGTRVTGGLRYTIDKRKLASYSDIDGGAFINAPNSPQRVTFKKITYRVALDHQLAQDVMIYAAYNRGFKSGLFNQVVFPLQPIEAVVRPEVIDAFTAGIKSELFDRKVRFNAEGFLNQAKNLQLERYVAGSTVLSNAAKARIYGIDIDIDFVPVHNLTLSWNLEVEKGRYRSLPSGFVNIYSPVTGGNPSGLPRDLKGNETIQTPPFTSSVSAVYQLPTSLGPLSFAASYFHGGNYFFDYDNGVGQGAPSKPSNDKQFHIDQVNASIDWLLGDGRYEVKVWVKNATNDKIIAFGSETLFNTQWSAGPPRTYGVTASLHL